MTAKTNTPTATEMAVAAMLVENTGRNILDSGMAYGYKYDKLKGVDWSTVPVARVVDGCYEKSLYWHLVENLLVDTEETARFVEFANTEERKYDSWPEILQDYCKAHKYTGLEGDNSYNYDSTLDGVFQWFVVEGEDRDMIVVQTHNGCDVRGGYSTPVWFEPRNGFAQDCGISMIAEGTLHCSGDTDHRFYTDDAYHWYSDTEMGSFKLQEENGNLLCPHCNAVLTA